ncbi:MAG: UDP-2,3-diacylglucosamine diphosphatase [Bacteroidota bacterium]
MAKRKVDVVIISDVHLGTYGCHAKELLAYLKSIKPGLLILNGDIIDGWQFKKRYFPKSHMAVIQRIVKIAASGIPVHYLSGNHDEFLRRFTPFELANFHLDDKLLLEVDGKKMWVFHGDVFDVSIQYSKWIAKLGGQGYNLLIFMNNVINWVLSRLGRPRMSFSKKVKESVKRAVKYISDFEDTAAHLAIDQGYDYVVCGHIHQPQIRDITNRKGAVTYLNSGDWVENLTALEYADEKWSIYTHDRTNEPELEHSEGDLPSPEALLQKVTEFTMTQVWKENSTDQKTQESVLDQSPIES